VVVADLNVEAAEKAAKDIKSRGLTAAAVRVDIFFTHSHSLILQLLARYTRTIIATAPSSHQQTHSPQHKSAY
jgi:hypothetical protein